MSTTSPFHAGEVAIQAQAGEAPIATRNAQLISDRIPNGALKFVDRQPMAVATTLDAQLRPWTSLLAGTPGFLLTEGPSQLRLNPALLASAPDDIFWQNLPYHPLAGLLFIELSTRRRLKVNGPLQQDGDSWLLTVEECFPLCPRYIQQRSLTVSTPHGLADAPTQTGTALSAELTDWIARADTLFVGSSHDNHHLDAGHRGGKPGFVRVEDAHTLLIPDYNGNSLFNTLGNLTLNPHASLLFVDFERGETLQLTGTADVLMDPLAGADDTGGTGRHWRFHLAEWRQQASLRNLAWTFMEYSPSMSELTYRPFRIAAKVAESRTATSFYLEPADQRPVASYLAGQYLPVRVTVPGQPVPLVRSYTLSEAPGQSYYRITVKREAAGTVSVFLHDAVMVGDVVNVAAPQGSFVLPSGTDAQPPASPLVLLSAGVGITPMLSLLAHALNQQPGRVVWFVHAARSQSEQIQGPYLRALAAHHPALHLRLYHTAPEPGERRGTEYDETGRPTAAGVAHCIPNLATAQVYLCGPTGFMQQLRPELLAAGVAPAQLFTESFGLAAEPVPATAPSASAPAQVWLQTSQREVRWDGRHANLLQLLQEAGLNPPYSCGMGSCLTCQTPLLRGDVTYEPELFFDPEPGTVLLCCAQPVGDISLDL